MQLGGFVIHGNNVGTLGACLDSLLAVCDEVVAVDSNSADGSAGLVRTRGVRAIVHRWQGYGAARAVAARALSSCDYLLFLDSDERLLPEAVERLRAWKASEPQHPYYKLRLRDWAELPERRFVFRVERHIRLIRWDAAAWTPEMIVHEAMPRARAVFLDADIEHRFATSLEARREKEDRYALLWALRAHAEGRSGKIPWVQHLAHSVRNAILKGAAFRGGWVGARLAWEVARYHARKYVYLDQIRHGLHAAKVAALREGQFEELFEAEPERGLISLPEPGSPA